MEERLFFEINLNFMKLKMLMHQAFSGPRANNFNFNNLNGNIWWRKSNFEIIVVLPNKEIAKIIW